jgi:integrase
MPENLDVFKKEARFNTLHARFTARTDQNAQDVCKYVHKKLINTSPQRCLEYYNKLGTIEPSLKGKLFRDLTQDDLTDVFQDIRGRRGRRGKISVRSLNNYKNELKAFLKFLGKPDVAASIKKDRTDELNFLTPEDMLTEQDIEALIRAADTPRNRAIIATLAETGMRPVELFRIQIKDVQLSSQTKTITIYSKNKKRTRPIIGCVSYLAAWINVHPKPDDPNAPLFIKKDGSPVGYWSVVKMVRLTFKRAKVKKPAMLKLFRHSTNTYLYSKFPQEIAGKLQGHVPGSQMARHYVHLNQQTMMDEYSSLYGQKPHEEVKPLLMPKTCVVCGLENSAEKVACERCKNPLTLKNAVELTSPNKLIDDVLSEDSELMKQLEEKITERIMKQVEEQLNSPTIRTYGKSGIVGI